MTPQVFKVGMSQNRAARYPQSCSTMIKTGFDTEHDFVKSFGGIFLHASFLNQKETNACRFMKRQALDQPFATIGDRGILFHSHINLAICEGLCSTGGGSTNCRFNGFFFSRFVEGFFSRTSFFFFRAGTLEAITQSSIQWRFASDANLHDLGFRLSDKVTYTGKSGSPMSGLPFPRRMHLKSPTFTRQGVWRVVMEYVFQLPSLKLTVRT